MIDYDAASQTYDHSRTHSDKILERFARRISFTAATTMLDFGCGTGNYLDRLQQTYGARCCGVEPSEGMRAQAIKKNAALDVRPGDHRNLPFNAEAFDSVFMTDVIHHVPDLASMFAELFRVLKCGGSLCVVTESHEQIQHRFYNVYFPSLAANETRRYPEILQIVRTAVAAGFIHEGAESLPAPSPARITEQFLRSVEEQNYSMFRLLDEREYADGLARAKRDQGRSFDTTGAGDSLVWFRKHPLRYRPEPTNLGDHRRS